jgi:predicted AlkP superfamily pyrophosphatase or phosphodiesterase
VTAEKQGQKAGAFFFPGTEAEIAGYRPTFWKQYDGKIENKVRVEQILAWLDLPVKERPTFYTLYFSDTDDAGHKYSPDSEKTRKAVQKVDGELKLLMNGLKKRKVDKTVNIIIVSDHGMATVLPENYMVLDNYFNFDLAEKILWTREIVQIFPKQGKEEEIMSGLKSLDRATCWKKAEIPERLHYNKGSRVAPIVCSAQEGFYLTSKDYLEKNQKRDDWNTAKGAHGYDNKYQSMQATFIAHGAAFKKGYTAEPFENIHVYELMCEILGLKPAPNDGDLSKVSSMLKK